jgi:hypothetical protein
MPVRKMSCINRLTAQFDDAPGHHLLLAPDLILWTARVTMLAQEQFEDF